LVSYNLLMNQKIFIVIPAYNEAQRIGKVLEGAKSYASRTIIVDDGSRDATYSAIRENFSEVIALRHKINLGKGAALKTGCDAAVKLGADIIVVMDADGQHNPEDIPRFTEAIQSGNLDIVFGVRHIGREMPLASFLGNKFLTVMINFMFNIFINDTQSGFRAFTKESYEKIRWDASDYAMETEMIVNAGQAELRYGEVDIATIYHDKYKGTTPLDGIVIFFKMLKWKFL